MKKDKTKFKKTKGKSHLDKDFIEELKHKLWSTKGTRFCTSKRLKIKNKYSLLSLSSLSAYLIIFGLLSVYNLYTPPSVFKNLIPFTITAISIFLLVFSLFEYSKNYSIRANEFHKCALEIARIYNELQTFKTYKKEATNKEKNDFALDLQDRYQSILEKYENHLPIDNKVFKLGHLDYYTEIKKNDILNIRFRYFIGTYFWYLFSMIIPGLILTYIIIMLN